MDLAMVWIFAEVMIGGLALGALLILIRPRDEEAAALYRCAFRRAWTWCRFRREGDTRESAYGVDNSSPRTRTAHE